MRKRPTQTDSHRSALDQAEILIEHLRKTATKDLDWAFIQAHSDAIYDFLQAAKREAGKTTAATNEGDKR